MYIILLVAMAAIAAYGYLSHKYNNPYTSTFIFGKKGAGKSLWMVREMMKLHRRGWNIYTDMEDVNLPYARLVKLKDLEICQPEPHSAIFLDEVGISMDNRNFKSFPPGLRDFVKYSRKMKIKLYMNSQTYDVDKKVRDTVDRLILLKSVGGFLSIVRPIVKKIVLVESSAEAESRIAENLKFDSLFSWGFVYMPRYFKYFNSLKMNTVRPPLPYSLPAAKSAGGPDARPDDCPGAGARTNTDGGASPDEARPPSPRSRPRPSAVGSSRLRTSSPAR